MAATRAGGEEVVLKLNFPEEETEHEADALAWWRGDGAVRLLEHDRARGALLVERLRPGLQLWARPEGEALAVAAGVLRRLRRAPPADGPFRRLADEAARWARELPPRWEAAGRPCSRRVVDEAVDAANALATSQTELVVVHQDLHGGNILRAAGGWLAIDPKPLLGEPAFDCASLIRDRRWELVGDPGAPARIARRLDVLADALELERDRLRGWGLVHALAWGIDADGRFSAEHVACAEWLAAAR